MKLGNFTTEQCSSFDGSRSAFANLPNRFGSKVFGQAVIAAVAVCLEINVLLQNVPPMIVYQLNLIPERTAESICVQRETSLQAESLALLLRM